jgi:O-antigen biosynthesis protein
MAKTEDRTALCVIVKNEVTEIAEWILHHKSLGFLDIIVYDNESVDGTTEVLRHLQRDLGIHYIPWPTGEGGSATQISAYQDCIVSSKGAHDWVAFLDADEFLVPQGDAQLQSFLKRLDQSGAIALNWLLFGSSGLIDGTEQNAMRSYTRRAAEKWHGNRHIKCFVRPEDVQAIANPHHFKTTMPCVNVRGETMQWGQDDDAIAGIVPQDAIVHGDEFRLHHYLTRSRVHWLQRMARGQLGEDLRRESEFETFDRNEVLDNSGVPYGDQAADWLSRLPSAREILAIKESYRSSEEFQDFKAKAEKTSRMGKSLVPAGLGKISTLVFTVDYIGEGTIRGWACNEHQADPATFRIYVDKTFASSYTCDYDRPDVRDAGYFSALPGYKIILPDGLLDGRLHILSILDDMGMPVRITYATQTAFSVSFRSPKVPTVKGNLDGFEAGYFRGWAVRLDGDGKWRGGVQVEIRTNGVRVTTAMAHRPRADVAQALGYDAHCGFEVSVPPAFRRTHPQSFEVVAVPEAIELAGSPISAIVVTKPDQVMIYEVSDVVERLYREVAALRLKIRSLRNQEHYTISNYDRWYRLYRDRLKARVDEASKMYSNVVARETDPLVSIIVPVYRPALGHFRTAVQSVLAQSYERWELILVDDYSNKADLSDYLDEVAAKDQRVRVIQKPRNSGISSTTNAGIKIALGTWIVFFDHDDVLDECAVEVMVRAAQATGAKLLYSDEDKIDELGYFSEPAFKTTYNPRLLLSYNYINHLTMVDAALARSAGALRHRYDGAQDHDFLLRATRHLAAKDIHHVAEILYHWRKTETSTSTAVSAKSYAIANGRRAVADHLKQLERNGVVHPLGQSTHYRIEWAKPVIEPRVRIVIPFREQAKVTRKCLDAILFHTAYADYDVVLIDNWSCTTDAAEFVDYANAHPNVSVFRIEEEFNYSRLNNLALLNSDAEFFLLLNNDVFVEQADWLHILVGEAMLSEDVGAVAGKYLYPDRTIQHAGVIVGQGGVAGHFYTGRPADYPGYIARAQVAQNMSAVTAACMLVRASAFRAVGGLDEVNLRVAFNDIDLCLRLLEQGYQVVWTPEFVAEHHESLSRGSDNQPEMLSRFHDEVQFMQTRWPRQLEHDIFFSRFFSMDGEAFFDLVDPTEDATPIRWPRRKSATAVVPSSRRAPQLVQGENHDEANPITTVRYVSSV